MKKVSAFAALKGKKEKGNKPDAPIKKASSTTAIHDDTEKTSSKLIRAIKGGSFRSTIRGNKHRPTVLADGLGNSPFVAGNDQGVKLMSIKDKEKKAPKLKMLPPDVTPTFPVKNKPKQVTPKSSSASKQKKPLPPLPSDSITDTPRLSNGHVKGDTTLSPIKNRKLANTLPVSPKQKTSSQSTAMISHSSTPKDGASLLKDVKDESSKKKRKRSLSSESPSGSTKKKKTMTVKQEKPSKQKKAAPSRNCVSPSIMMDKINDSQEDALTLFQCMLNPVKTDKFFKEIWEKKPLLVTRHTPNYNKGWFSSQELDTILQEEHIEFGVNLDVTKYKNGKRETHNPVGRAYKSVVWDHYQNGCSVRLLNPQTYSKNVWKYLSTLQEYFHCCVGANVYLTPPGTQGFAPHYDDIEAFILQLEGQKHWKLYSPRSAGETLPVFSSGNFTEADLGEPILDITLKAGDLLYFPRGTIHQGSTSEDAHSLHITVSCFQKNTWGHLLQKLLPRAVDIAMEEDVAFREGLPLDYLNYMGLVNSDIESDKRSSFMEKLSGLLERMVSTYLPTDTACDQMGRQYIADSLPPVITEGEKACSIHGHGEHWVARSNGVRGNTEIEPDTMVKLVRKGSVRLLSEEDNVRVYHNMENARVYHGRDPQYIEITPELAPVVETLIHTYPEYISVESFPVETLDEKIVIATILYDKGLIVTGEPLSSVHEESDSDEDDEV